MNAFTVLYVYISGFLFSLFPGGDMVLMVVTYVSIDHIVILTNKQLSTSSGRFDNGNWCYPSRFYN